MLELEGFKLSLELLQILDGLIVVLPLDMVLVTLEALADQSVDVDLLLGFGGLLQVRLYRRQELAQDYFLG